MQILVVSDLHYTLKQLDWVAAAAPEYDLVVVAGDLLDIASIVDPDAQIAVVLEYLTRLASRTKVAVCSGNHDLNARNDLDERAARWLESATAAGVVIDGARLETDDLLVTVCAFWDGPRSCAVVDAQLAEDAGPGRRPHVALGVPRTAGRVTDQLDRQASLRRRGAVGVDRPSPSRRRPVRARPPVPLRRRRRLVRSHRHHDGLQRRPADRPRPHAHRDRHRPRHRALAVARGSRGARVAGG